MRGVLLRILQRGSALGEYWHIGRLGSCGLARRSISLLIIEART